MAPVQDGRIYVELINGPFLKESGTVRCRAGLRHRQRLVVEAGVRHQRQAPAGSSCPHEGALPNYPDVQLRPVFVKPQQTHTQLAQIFSIRPWRSCVHEGEYLQPAPVTEKPLRSAAYSWV